MGRKFPSADTMLKFVTVLQIPPEGLFKQIQEPDTATDFQRYTAAYAAQLSNALISYVSESLGYYSGRQTLSGSKPDENQL